MGLFAELFKKIPDSLTCVQIPVGFTDYELGKILMTARPGVTASFYLIQDDSGTIGTLPIDAFSNPRAVFRVGVGFQGNFRVR